MATKSDLQLLRSDLQLLRGEMQIFRSEFQGELKALRSDLEKSIADAQMKTVFWLGGMMLTPAGVILAGFRLL